jgi:hypothetical protein
MTLPDLRDLLLTIMDEVYHFEATEQTDKYIVWAEEGQSNSDHADNQIINQEIEGTIDYFTKDEFDSNVSLIQEKLDSADLTWELNSIQREEETGYIHYEWLFRLVNPYG